MSIGVSTCIDKITGRYLGRHMGHLADRISQLSQSRENWCISREGIPVDDTYGENVNL